MRLPGLGVGGRIILGWILIRDVLGTDGIILAEDSACFLAFMSVIVNHSSP